jgi:hypothetical protein
MPGDENTVGGGTSWSSRDHRKFNFTHTDTRSVTMIGPHTEQVAVAVTCVFEWCSVRIAARTAAVLTGHSRSSSVPPGKCRGYYVRPRELLSKYFQIHQSSYHPTLYTLR